MNNYQKLAILSFVSAIVFLIISSIRGEGKSGLFIIFPFFYGEGIFALLGIIFLIISFFLFFFGFIYKFENFVFETKKEKPTKDEYRVIFKEEKIKTDTKTNYGGVVLIGPIPIIFGKDVKLTIILVILAIVLILIVWFLFYWK